MKKHIRFVCTIMVTVITALMMNSAVLAEGSSKVLQQGDTGDQIYSLQRTLNEKGYLSANPTGYFGSLTVAAVKAFQRDQGINVDGKVGSVTLSKLQKSSSEKAYHGNIRSDVFSLGDSSSQVTDIQRRLAELGYLDLKEFTTFYGKLTAESIRRFQQSHGLKADGVTGPATLSCLFSSSVSSSVNSHSLKPGMRSEEVKTLQRRLIDLGYLSADATGFYGTMTESAVQSFQKANNLVADGIAGAKTKKVLFSSAAKRAGNISYSSDDNDTVSKLIRVAKSKLGSGYVWAAEGPNTFDCSGFMYYVLNNSGIKVRRLSAAGFSQISEWKKINSISDLRKGDLLFFHESGSSGITHAGIYIGGGEFIHASSAKRQVVIFDLESNSYYREHFSFARRPNY